MITFITNTVIVKIYKRKCDMRRAIRAIGYDCTHTESMVVPMKLFVPVNGKMRRANISCELYTHEQASMPVLVHETLHAATTTLRHKKESLRLSYKINLREEMLAYTQTAILQDVLKRFFPQNNSDYNFKDVRWWAKNSVKSSRRKK